MAKKVSVHQESPPLVVVREVARKFTNSISSTLSIAVNKRVSDIFIYPRDFVVNPIDTVQWLTIGEFTTGLIMEQIFEFIDTWNLNRNTKFAIKNTGYIEYELRGLVHLVEVVFSRPTPSCPNPLAVAKVVFLIYVSSVLPETFPVMVKYRFEGFKLEHSAHGEDAKKVDFQDFYIDLILKAKLSFYKELCAKKLLEEQLKKQCKEKCEKL